MGKGTQILQDYLSKLIIVCKSKDVIWKDFEAMIEARQRLENHLEPPRDDKGHFMAQPLTTKEQE